MKTEQMIEKLKQAQALLSDIYHEAPSNAVESQMSVADSCIIESIDALKKLKTYRIEASYTTYLSKYIEAESLDKALDLAKELDGGEFNEGGYSDWNIDSVTEAQQ